MQLDICCHKFKLNHLNRILRTSCRQLHSAIAKKTTASIEQDVRRLIKKIRTTHNNSRMISSSGQARAHMPLSPTVRGDTAYPASLLTHFIIARCLGCMGTCHHHPTWLRCQQQHAAQKVSRISPAWLHNLSSLWFASGDFYYSGEACIKDQLWVVYELWKWLQLKYQTWMTLRGQTFGVWWLPVPCPLGSIDIFCTSSQAHVLIAFKNVILGRLTQNFCISASQSQHFNFIKTLTAESTLKVLSLTPGSLSKKGNLNPPDSRTQASKQFVLANKQLSLAGMWTL